MSKRTEEQEPRPHLGHKVQRLREVLGMKQAVLARATGMSQQNASKLEQSETIPDQTLERLAKGLGVTAGFIRRFDEEEAVRHLQQHILATCATSSHHAIDKAVALFEQLLQLEKEKMKLLTRVHQDILALAEQLHALEKEQPLDRGGEGNRN
ncbi:helix-turn-helix domain-containing protein [Pontibacter sp. SGAir0037]|uniref:helix-turn-helix domain-containing protein n=1 Tax=Pontibacter sp. SGAir0037 TaxID=2571030 RepID=UPI0010CCD64F|nr:helix-turn-helix transcriptional regulator [Pontibacter sp. SGAir0037]QCR24487.1 transcriptional regulator [Pontibacter sp. SGAir0037]